MLRCPLKRLPSFLPLVFLLSLSAPLILFPFCLRFIDCSFHLVALFFHSDKLETAAFCSIVSHFFPLSRSRVPPHVSRVRPFARTLSPRIAFFRLSLSLSLSSRAVLTPWKWITRARMGEFACTACRARPRFYAALRKRRNALPRARTLVCSFRS